MSAIGAALMALEDDASSLDQLTARLCRFNIFAVLGATNSELRHSNMLAWLFDPNESHGLGDAFLMAWLKELDATERLGQPKGGFVNFGPPLHVKVLKEHLFISATKVSRVDLLIRIQFSSGDHWVVCIENKVGSQQADGQLGRYFQHIERDYRKANKRLYVLLSRDSEVPDHPAFGIATYLDVDSALSNAIEGASFEQDVETLLTSYRDILREKFMPKSPTELLAQSIYDRHSKAIDYIVNVRQEVLGRATAVFDEALANNSQGLRIVVDRDAGGTIVRFLPKSWDVAQNRNRVPEDGEHRYVWCEVTLHTPQIQLDVVCGFPPEDWIADLWERASIAPFNRTGTSLTSDYVKPHRVVSPISREEIKESTPVEAAERLMAWLSNRIQSREFQAVSAEIESAIAQLGTG